MKKTEEQKNAVISATVETLRAAKNETIHQAGKVAKNHPILRIPLLVVVVVFLFVYNVFLYTFIHLKMREKLARAMAVLLTLSLTFSQVGLIVTASTNDGENAAGEVVVEEVTPENAETGSEGTNAEGTGVGDDGSGENGSEESGLDEEGTGDNIGETGAEESGTEETNPEGEKPEGENPEDENSEDEELEGEELEDEELEKKKLEELEEEEPEEEFPEFEENTVVDGVCVCVKADEGVLPEGAYLSVRNVSSYEENEIENAVDEIRDANKKVVASYNFDITIFNKDGEEIQPNTEAGSVKVTFTLVEATNDNLSVDVYHVKEEGETLVAEELSKEVDEQTGEIVAETDGFSFYTVEFTYNGLQYVLEGDGSALLSEILSTVGIEINGEISSVIFSNDELLAAENIEGEWIVKALRPFDTNEWMKVTIAGIEYEVVLTDSQSPAGDSFVLGKFDDATGTFKDAWGSGSTVYKTILIMFTDERLNNESVSLPSESGFSLNSCSTDYTKIITMSGGRTASQVADYVKKVKFVNCNSNGQNIKITLSTNEIKYQTVFYEGTGHYYQFVPISSATAWTTAYNNARSMYFLGEQGYLATVTSVSEDNFLLKSVRDATGWLGGTTMKCSGGDGTSYYDSFSSTQSQGYWYWACGPEKGQHILDTLDMDTISNKASYYAEQAKKYYFNWNNGEPNYDDNGANCLTILNLTGGSGYNTKTTYCWNDVINTRAYSSTDVYSPKGYFVEYGGATGGGSSSGSNNDMEEEGGIYADIPDYLVAAGLSTKDIVIYNPRSTPKIITVKKNITLTKPIVLPANSNVQIDLDNHTVTGATGQSVITAPDGVKVQLEVINGTLKTVTGDEEGADGVPVIDLSKAGSGTSVKIGEDDKKAEIIASNGNDSSTPGGSGGAGGIGIKTNDNVSVDVDDNSKVQGGTGGSGTKAGAGGEAVGDGRNTGGGGGGENPPSGGGGEEGPKQDGGKGREHTHAFLLVTCPTDASKIEAYCTAEELKCEYYGTTHDDALSLATVSISTTDATYDGTPKAQASINGAEAFDSATGKSAATASIVYFTDEALTQKTDAINSGAVTQGSAPIFAGTYYASITVDGAVAKKAFVINKTAISYTAPTDANALQNGLFNPLLTFETPEGGTFYFRLGENGEWSTEIPKASLSGSYKVYYYIKADGNHEDLGSKESPLGSLDCVVKVLVSFNSNLSNSTGITMPDSQIIEKDSAPLEPIDPVITDSSSVKVDAFVGWFSDSQASEEYDFTKTLDKSTVVYANWTFKPLKVGDKYYRDIEAAVEEVENSGQPLELLDDYVVDGDVTIPAPGVKLNGHVLENTDDTTITIKGGVEGEGTFKGPGKVSLQDVTIKGDVVNESEIEIQGEVIISGDEENPGKLENKGTISIPEDTKLTVEEGGGITVDRNAKIKNDGELSNDGTIDNKGKMEGNRPTGDGKVIVPPAPNPPEPDGGSSDPAPVVTPTLVKPVVEEEPAKPVTKQTTKKTGQTTVKPVETTKSETETLEETLNDSNVLIGGTTDVLKKNGIKNGDVKKLIASEETSDKEKLQALFVDALNGGNIVVTDDPTGISTLTKEDATNSIGSILTEKEILKMLGGERISLRTEVTVEFEEDITPEVARNVEENVPEEMAALTMFNVNLYKQIGNKKEQQVENGKVRVTIEVPKEQRPEDEETVYYLLRVYEDEDGVLRTEPVETIQEGYMLTFDADTESDYVVIVDADVALAYGGIGNKIGSLARESAEPAGQACRAHWFELLIAVAYLGALYVLKNKDKKVKLALFGVGTVCAVVVVIVGDCVWDVVFAAGTIVLSLASLNVIRSKENEGVFATDNSTVNRVAYALSGVGALVLVVGTVVCLTSGLPKLALESDVKDLEVAAEVEPVEAEPAEVEPVEIEPVEVETAEIEPVEVETVEVAPVEIEPVEVETAQIEPTEVETKVKVPEPEVEGEVTSETVAEPEEAENVTISVAAGMDSRSIANLLEAAGIVSSAAEYDNFLCSNGYDRRMQVGEFIIPKNATEDEIAKILTS